MFKLLICCFLILGACNSKQTRQPNSSAAEDIQFNIFANNNEDYNYDLLNLEKVKMGKVLFTQHKLNDENTGTLLQSWRDQLKWLSQVAPEKIKIEGNKYTVSLTQINRLYRAIELIDAENTKPDLKRKKQIEIITAFNKNFTPESKFNLNLNNLPVTLLKNVKSNFDFKKIFTGHNNNINSSFSSIATLNALKIEKILPTQEQRCEISHLATVGTAVNELAINCQAQHFKIITDQSAKTAAFNSRMLRSFGYFADDVSIISEVNVNYDRSILLKLNKLNLPKGPQQEQDVGTRAVAGLANNSNKANAFVVLKNGDKFVAKDALKKLLPYCKGVNFNCSFDESLVDAQFEKEIDFIQFKNVGLAYLNPADHEFGPWNFEDLAHPQKYELRQLFLLASLTSNWAIQSHENKLVWSAKNFSIFHKIGSINAGFSRGQLNSEFDLNAMNWTNYAKKKSPNGNIIQIEGYRPNIQAYFFDHFEMSDLQQAARAIAGITEDQITQWLAESGFSSAELILAREKLISRQKNLIETLDLQSEFSDLSKRIISKSLNFEPQATSHRFVLSTGREIVVDNFGFYLKNGTLKPKL